jgi:hypothetical protein
MSKSLNLIGGTIMLLTAICFVGIGVIFGIKIYIDWLSAIFPDKVHQYVVSLAIVFAIGLIFYLLSEVFAFFERQKIKKEWEKRWH